jgi:hypothetical protein
MSLRRSFEAPGLEDFDVFADEEDEAIFWLTLTVEAGTFQIVLGKDQARRLSHFLAAAK